MCLHIACVFDVTEAVGVSFPHGVRCPLLMIGPSYPLNLFLCWPLISHVHGGSSACFSLQWVSGTCVLLVGHLILEICARTAVGNSDTLPGCAATPLGATLSTQSLKISEIVLWILTGLFLLAYGC